MLDPAGGFSPEELAKTLSENFGAGDDAGIPPPVRFLRGVAKVVRKRALGVPPGPSAAPSVFLFTAVAPPPFKDAAVFRPMLNNGLTDVEGQLWFVGGTVASGWGAALGTADDAEIWARVIDTGLGDVPAVVYDPRCSPPELRYYSHGLSDADDCRTTQVTATAGVTLDRIFEAIDHLHRDQLITPDGQSEAGRLWADPNTARPIKEAERTVQMHVRTQLAAWFRTCTIRPEQHQVSGRLDLEIEEVDATASGGFVRHAVLELKVLRSKNSKGNDTPPSATAKWVADGVEQAHAYRKERKALATALCCFDMRAQHDDPFADVAEKAVALKVELRVWPLFSTAKKYRAWEAAQALAETAADAAEQQTGTG